MDNRPLSLLDLAILEAWRPRIKTVIQDRPDKIERLVTTETSWNFSMQKVVNNILSDKELAHYIEGEQNILSRIVEAQVEHITKSYLKDAADLHFLRASWRNRLKFLFKPNV